MGRRTNRTLAVDCWALRAVAAVTATTVLVSLSVLLGMLTAGDAALAETPREEKQVEKAEDRDRPAFTPLPSRVNQQQERQDRVRPAPVRDRKKDGESQQDARKRRNKDRILGQ